MKPKKQIVITMTVRPILNLELYVADLEGAPYHHTTPLFGVHLAEADANVARLNSTTATKTIICGYAYGHELNGTENFETNEGEVIRDVLHAVQFNGTARYKNRNVILHILKPDIMDFSPGELIATVRSALWQAPDKSRVMFVWPSRVATDADWLEAMGLTKNGEIVDPAEVGLLHEFGASIPSRKSMFRVMPKSRFAQVMEEKGLICELVDGLPESEAPLLDLFLEEHTGFSPELGNTSAKPDVLAQFSKSLRQE